MGFELIIHPNIPGTALHTDFLALLANQSKFYLEATVCLPPINEKSGNIFIDEIIDGINSIDSFGFWFYVKWSGAPKRSISKKYIKARLSKELSTLNVDALYHNYLKYGLENMPKVKMQFDGFMIFVQIIPKPPADRSNIKFRNVGMRMGDAYAITIDESIKRAIKEKGKKYGDLDIPILLAINCIDDKFVSIDNEDIFNAFFGKEQVILHLIGNKIADTSTKRDSDGAFIFNNAPIYQRIKAVMLSSNIRSTNFDNPVPVVWHNPYSTPPFDASLFRIPQMYPNHSKGEYTKINGEKTSTILGLDNAD